MNLSSVALRLLRLIDGSRAAEENARCALLAARARHRPPYLSLPFDVPHPRLPAPMRPRLIPRQSLAGQHR